MNKDDKRWPGIVKACVVTIGTVLILSTAFVFLAFRTDYIFNVEADSTFSSATFDRTTVTTVIEEIEDLEAGDGAFIPEVSIEDRYDDWWYTPEAGETIDVSFGIDVPTEQRVVTSTDTWTIEYSIQGCLEGVGANSTCYKRLMTAVNLFGINHNESGDLLKLSVDGVPCFAGAMIDGVFAPGDLVCVELDDGQQFHFLILDTKSNQHTFSDLGCGVQVQNAWGHGYPRDGGRVQLSICEFICNQTRGGQSNAKFLPSGSFLQDRKVRRAKVVKHVDIDNGGTVQTPQTPEMPGVPPEQEEETPPEETPPPQETIPPRVVGNYNISDDIANGLYTEEDIRYMASAVSTETNDYDSAFAICSAIINRVNGDPWWSSGERTIKAVCTKPGQMNGRYLSIGELSDMQLQAAAAVLHGEPSNIGGCTSWFGRVSGYDMYADPGAQFFNWGNNIFHSGGAHNKASVDTPAGCTQIYNHNTGEWIYPHGTGSG